MWLRLVAGSALLFRQGVRGEDCPFTVSVLDVPGVQCVTATPCSGTYYASGLSQGVGACPTGSGCALLPLTPIMGCAATGRTDLVYVNADGTLTKDGRSVTLLDTLSPTSDSSTTHSSMDSSSTNYATTDSSTTDSSSTKDRLKNTGDSAFSGTNASSGPGPTTTRSDGKAEQTEASNKTLNSTSFSTSTSNSSPSPTVSLGSSSANQQAQFDPGFILSDGSTSSESSSSGGLGLGSIIAIVVGCLAVVAIAAGARLLKKGKEAELATPGAAGGLEAYNNGGGGGGGMTPKENVLLL